ncbi:MAG: hypothetical protein C0469_10365 [Cyanobacteria bacterium DS2.3.42]|nr:hypothetical protein [Cyanobacteria bacterium DS2.3.42]
MSRSAKTAVTQKLPKGWFMAGQDPQLYEVSVDSSNAHSGTKCAYMRHSKKVKDATVWATLMQQMGPEKFRNKRLRMSFWVKTMDVKNWVQPWMRVDGEKGDDSLSFDNFCTRFIQGTTDWVQYSIVLDVPEESTNIAFGIMLGGQGELWFDDVSFETVGKEVPITDCPCSANVKATNEPRNLNFEEGEEDRDCA